MVLFQHLKVPYCSAQLRALVPEHHAATQSPLAERVLRELDRELPRFWQVVPKEMLGRPEVPVRGAGGRVAGLSGGPALARWGKGGVARTRCRPEPG